MKQWNANQILRMVMFQIKWCTKQRMFSMHGVPFVESTGIGTPGNTINLLQHTCTY